MAFVAPHADNPAGVLLRRVDLTSSVLTARTYPPRLRLPRHAHASAFLLFVRHGAFVEEQGRRAERFDRWSCIYRPELDEHANDFDAGATVAAIDVSRPLVERLTEAGFSGQRFSVRSPFVQQFGDRLEAELAAPDSMSELVIEALATEVIAFGARAGGGRARKGPWLERARRLIEHDFASPLSLAVVAAEVGVHPVHLARQFRASHGCSVGEYLRRVRIAFAETQLTTSDHPIAEIALAAGFSDQSQLTKSFRRITGQTPAAYRVRRR